MNSDLRTCDVSTPRDGSGGTGQTGTWPARPGARGRGISILLRIAIPVAIVVVAMARVHGSFRDFLSDSVVVTPLAFILLVGAVLAGYEFLRARNCRLTLIPDGLTIADWRGRPISLLWGDISRIREGRNGGTWLLVADRHGNQPPVRLVHGDAPGVESVRDAVLGHLSFAEVEPETGFWVTRRWRWWDGHSERRGGDDEQAGSSQGTR